MMVTTVPPPVLPEVGEMAATVGTAAAVVVNWSALPLAEVPLGVVTVMSKVPNGSGGATALMDVSDTIVKEVAGVVPNSTSLAPVKPLPVMVTLAPPTVVPLLGVTPVTAATAAKVSVKRSLALTVELP
jgi:hypothetical protein